MALTTWSHAREGKRAGTGWVRNLFANDGAYPQSGILAAGRLPLERFPFGHGKEVYFWSFVVAILIFGVGAGLSIYEGVRHILSPAELRNAVVNYIVLSLAIVFEGGAWWIALLEFRAARATGERCGRATTRRCSWCCSRTAQRWQACWSP